MAVNHHVRHMWYVTCSNPKGFLHPLSHATGRLFNLGGLRCLFKLDEKGLIKHEKYDGVGLLTDLKHPVGAAYGGSNGISNGVLKLLEATYNLLVAGGPQERKKEKKFVYIYIYI